MKQGIAAKAIKYSTLSLSILGFVAHAQLIELDNPADETAEATSEAPVEASAPTTLKSQPVAMSAGMAPAPAPAAPVAAASASQSQTQTQAASASVPAALGSGMMVNGSGNASPTPLASSANTNGGGTQINLNIKSDADARQLQNQGQESISDQSRLSELRIEKKVREQVNEERLMEKIEEDRIDGEKVRTRSIEGVKFSGTKGDLETVPVASAGAAASASGNGSATAIATVSTTESGSREFLGMTKFKLSPTIGYRWTQGNSYSNLVGPGVAMPQGSSQNLGVYGVSLEGVLNRYLSVEGNFLFGRDRLSLANGYGSAYYGNGYNGGGYYGNGGGFGGGVGYVGNGYVGNGYNPYGVGGSTYMGYRDTYEVNLGAKAGYEFNSGVRPFVAGAVGGTFQRYSIDNAFTLANATAAGWARTTNYFTSTFGGGLDYQMTRMFGLGARFDYQVVMTGSSPVVNGMRYSFGDAQNRMRLTASAQVIF